MKSLSMIPLIVFCLLLNGVVSLRAQSDVEGSAEAGLRGLALEKDIDWLARAAELEAGGVAPGELYEALLARFFLAKDVDSLVAIYGEIEERELVLPVGDGRLFADEAQRDGFVAAVSALRADQWGDVDGLRRFARMAQLKNPAAFAMFDLRDPLGDAAGISPSDSGEVRISLDTVLFRTGRGKETVGDILKGKKGGYFDFWASWCGPCIRAMPEFKSRSELYQPQGLAVVGVNTDSEDAQKKSADMAKRFPMELLWLIEPSDEPLSGPLRITSIPRVVVVDPTGKVLFNGHPDDLELKLALLDLGIAP